MNYIISSETIANAFLSISKKISSQKVRNADTEFINQCISLVNAENLNEAIYLIYHKLPSAPRCNCGNKLKLKTFTQGFSQFCSTSCSKKDPKVEAKRKATSLKKYGTPFPSQSNVVKDKIVDTNLSKWGAVHAMCTEITQQKRDNTNIEKYGGKAPACSELIREKTKKTNIEKYGGAAPMCSQDVYNKSRLSQINAWFPAKIKSLSRYVTPNFSILEYTDIESLYSWNCVQCNTNFLSNLVDGKIPKCPICYPHIKSRPEQEVADFISNLGFEVSRNNKTILTRKNKWPLELDIVIESHKLAIEFNGLYTHSQVGKDYHLFKTSRAAEQGYKLIHIFEDEWTHQRHIVESRIRSALGVNPKLYARKCNLVQLSNAEMHAFFELTHIQGACNASICLGLEFNGEIVAAMSFGKPRFNKKYRWELLRYASIGNVIGGASKLFKSFTTNHSENVISYCDRRYGTGDIYKKLGFVFDYFTKPGFFYIKDGKRVSRMNLQKHKLSASFPNFDSALTAEENIVLAGYSKIWDCGHYVFKYII